MLPLAWDDRRVLVHGRILIKGYCSLESDRACHTVGPPFCFRSSKASDMGIGIGMTSVMSSDSRS